MEDGVLTLEQLGWTERLAEAFRELQRPDWMPARIVRLERGVAHVRTSDGEVAARVGGRISHHADDPGERPAVGDWVAVTPETDAGEALVRARLPRRTRFLRQAAGRTSEPQVLAANLDTLLIVCGLDGDFNPRRIERYLALARAGGVDPVVVLNKTDLCDDLETKLAEARAAAPGVPVVAIGAKEGRGLDALEPWLERGTTLALVGSSGVGKSTLVNQLLGEDRVRTGEVRASDDRGRHTTTRRELFVLPGGALWIDTPGLRELQLSADTEDVGSAFPEIEQVAEGCKFRDCEHGNEPGCAVREASDAGTLDPARIEAWARLRREAVNEQRRKDERLARADSRRLGKLYKRIQSEKNNRR